MSLGRDNHKQDSFWEKYQRWWCSGSGFIVWGFECSLQTGLHALWRLAHSFSFGWSYVSPAFLPWITWPCKWQLSVSAASGVWENTANQLCCFFFYLHIFTVTINQIPWHLSLFLSCIWIYCPQLEISIQSFTEWQGQWASLVSETAEYKWITVPLYSRTQVCDECMWEVGQNTVPWLNS